MPISAPTPHKKARIEIIPLIDIMFFLLASFMLVSMSMIRLQAIDTKVPPPGPPPAKQPFDPKVIAINIDKDGKYYISKERTPIPVTEITARLKQPYIEQGQELKVFINADKDTSYESVIAALDQVRAMGLEKISFPVKVDNHFDPNAGPTIKATAAPAVP